MPGGKEPVNFLSESWDYPELIVPSVLVASQEETPEASGSARQNSGSEKTLEE